MAIKPEHQPAAEHFAAALSRPRGEDLPAFIREGKVEYYGVNPDKPAFMREPNRDGFAPPFDDELPF